MIRVFESLNNEKSASPPPLLGRTKVGGITTLPPIPTFPHKWGRSFFVSDAIKSAILIPLLVGLLNLTGCMVGPDYRQPETKVSDSFANKDFKKYKEDSIEIFWWRGYEDEELNKLIDLVLKGNLNIKIATARLLEARSLRTGTTLELFPIIDSEGSYTRQRFSRQTGFGFGTAGAEREFNLFDAGFDASWELDFFGRVRRSIEAESAEVEAALASRRDIIVSLLAETARNYFELRGTQNQLEVARRNAKNQQETFDLTNALLKGGRGTDLDTSRANAQLKSTLATIPPLEAQVKSTVHRLSVLAGKQPDVLYNELLEPKPLPDLPEFVSVGNPTELLRRRQDIRFAERSLAAATARIGVAVADLFPRVTLFGSLGLSADTFTGLGDNGADRFAIGPSITWAAFDLGRVKARIDASDARAQAALSEYELTVLTALEETENSLIDFAKELERRDYLKEAADSSEKAVELSRLRYKFGVSDFLTVLDAERRLLEAQDELARSETRTATALVAVYKALGGGWEIGESNQYGSKTINYTE